MSPFAGYVVETLVTVALVCAFAFVLLYGARKVGIGRAMGPLELVGRLPIDARRSVVLVKVGAQVIVVGVSEGGLTKLAELPFADLPVAPKVERSFKEVLASAVKGDS